MLYKLTYNTDTGSFVRWGISQAEVKTLRKEALEADATAKDFQTTEIKTPKTKADWVELLRAETSTTRSTS